MKKDNEDKNWLSIVQRNVETLHYGVVQVIVHNSKIVQVERTEKIRLDTDATKGKEVTK